MSEFFPVFVLGLGEKARGVVQNLKLRMEAENPRPYLVYQVVSAEVDKYASEVLPADELRFSVRQRRVPSQILVEQYGPLAGEPNIQALLGEFSMLQHGFSSAIEEKLRDLTRPDRWSGERVARTSVDVYMVVDTEDPLCLVFADMIAMLQQASLRTTAISLQVIFLALNPAPIRHNLSPNCRRKRTSGTRKGAP